jgi:glycosyltransferase involved in cell wall biosynthesis
VTTDRPPRDESGSFPRICIGVVALRERLPLVRLLLGDIGDQTSPAVEVLLVLQGVDPDDADPLSQALSNEFSHLPLSVIRNPLRGVNSARNLILDACSADVVVFMDDDARLPEAALQRVASAFRAHPDAAVITFKTRWVGDDPRPRRYPTEAGRRRSPRSITPVAAVEMIASISHIRSLGVRFDERFGPGGRFGAGDEFLFLLDVIRAGGVVLFMPMEIAQHEAQTGGRRMTPEKIAVRGAMLRRAFGVAGLGAGLLFVARKTLTRELECSPLVAAGAVVEGWREFGRDR